MSYTRETTLWCDNGECMNWETFSTAYLKIANSMAKSNGWTIRGEVHHICPKCANAATQKTNISTEGKINDQFS